MIELENLSERQRQMVELAGAGHTDKEIALRLHLSEGTLRTYWDRLRARMGAQSRTEVLARLAQYRYDRLSTAHEELLAVVNQLPQFVWTASPEGFVGYCNEWFSRYSGLTQEECLGPGCRILMPEEEHVQSAERWRNAQVTRQPYEAQVRFRCGADGSLRWHMIRLFPLKTKQGEVYRWVGTAHELFPQGAVNPFARPESIV
ncbi:MAG: PAS domain S-box protein [Fimbriimonas sp.]